MTISISKLRRILLKSWGARLRRAISVKRVWTIIASVLFATVTLDCTSWAKETKPNVVLIVIDDLGWADLGCYGSKFHKTPNLDQMATGGMRFTQAYAAAPVGLPTRVALLTGRYPQRMNMTGSFVAGLDDPQHPLIAPAVNRRLPLAEFTIAEALKSAGYRTACIGKWNLGEKGFGPSEQGFDVNIAGDASSVKYSEIAPYADAKGNLIPGLEVAPKGEFLIDRLAAETQKFITEHAAQPFFVYWPQFAVHLPSAIKPEIRAKYGPFPTEPNGKQINPDYAALVESMDQAVGSVLQTLDELKLSERTLVLFTSDNGGVCNSNGQIIPPTSNAPLRDGMGHLYEGGLRIPLIARWPGVIPAHSVSNEIVSCMDLFPTILEACGLTPQAESRPTLDGVSLASLLNGSGKLTRDAIFWHFPHYNVNAGSKPGAAVRAGDWKLIQFYGTDRRELFNVGKEPGESRNLIEENADVARELSARLDGWRALVGARKPEPNPRYAPNLQNDDGSIVIPASTANVFGVMLRYEPLPNKDTLGFWVREQDWASVEFTIKRPGRFHVVPHVGCGTAGGSVVDFAVANQTLSLTVPGTGHFQKFIPQDLGIVTLEKPGVYTMTITPRKKEGVAIMDVRKIELRPVAER